MSPLLIIFPNMYMPKKKSGIFIFLLKFKALVENEKERTIKCLKTDNRGEYTSKISLTFAMDMASEDGILYLILLNKIG